MELGGRIRKIAHEKVISLHKICFLPLALCLEYDRENVLRTFLLVHCMFVQYLEE